jgi:1-phosphatidylinositol phosphodiesterase
MTCKDHYCSVSTPKEYNPNWMSKLGNMNISEMTIPGTHDSCAKVNLFEWLQCHSWSMGYQLLAGIRFFDIRCRHINNKFDIYHDMFYCGLSFSDVLDECRNFLAKYQGEAIIMRIKPEYKSENCTRSFQDTFIEYLSTYDDILHLSEKIPMLDDVRGKVWVLQEFDFDIGFSWGKAMLQDEYTISTGLEVQTKIAYVRDFIQITKENEGKELLFINFCSGVGWGGTWPYKVADLINWVLFEYTGKLGIIVMDFPGEKVIEHIILQNYPEGWEVVHHLDKNDYVLI